MNRRCWLAHGSEVGRLTQHKPAPARAKNAPLSKQAPRTTTWCCGEQLVQPCSSQHSREDNEPQRKIVGHTPRMKTKKRPCWPAMQGAERHAKLLACAADAGYRDCSCRGGRREAESLPCKKHTGRPVVPTLMPNPSLKRTPNGIAFWPRTGCRAHFPVRGQNTMPSVAA